MNPQSKGQRRPAGHGLEKKMSWQQSAMVLLAIAALFVGFAALMTLMAPSYELVLQRGASGVNGRLERRVLWWIPFGVQKLEQVTTAVSVTQQPDRTESPSSDRDSPPQQVTPEANGYLVLKHAGGETRPMVSPENLDEMKRAVTDFLRDGPAEMHLRLVANWKFGVVIPAILAVLGVLPLASVLVESGWRLIVKK